MSLTVRALVAAEFPPLLREIPQPPKQLFAAGALPPPELTLLAVVGSRKYSTYGKQVIEHLVSGLSGYPIGIVSGLAIGVDGLAHEAALKYGLYTCAVPGSGLAGSVLYPARHRHLAERIVAAGGGVLSEYEPLTPAARWTFPERNRLMAGMTHGTLLIESTEKSGTLITARLAADYNRELMVVPGNIFSANTAGNHQFLKLGATPVTHSDDILDALGIAHAASAPTSPTLPLHSPEESILISLLTEPLERDILIRRSGLDTATANTLLMKLEIEGHLTAEQNIYRRII